MRLTLLDAERYVAVLRFVTLYFANACACTVLVRCRRIVTARSTKAASSGGVGYCKCNSCRVKGENSFLVVATLETKYNPKRSQYRGTVTLFSSIKLKIDIRQKSNTVLAVHKFLILNGFLLPFVSLSLLVVICAAPYSLPMVKVLVLYMEMLNPRRVRKLVFGTRKELWCAVGTWITRNSQVTNMASGAIIK